MGDPTSAHSVLIAAEETDFKRAVVDEPIKESGSDDYYFAVIGLGAIGGQDGYGAVLLLAWYSGGRVDRRATAFI